VRRIRRSELIPTYRRAREETLSVTASREAVRVEKEIDERVKALYGLTEEEVKIVEEKE